MTIALRISDFLKILILTILFYGCNNSITIEKAYFENGALKSVVEKNIKGERHGELITFYNEGDTLNISHWKNGIQEGEEREYYNHNKLKAIFRFYNGELNGKTLLFYESGNLQEILPFKDDLLNGEAIAYFDSKENIISGTTDYLNFHDKETAMGWIKYNIDGSIHSQESKITVVSSTDTIQLGDSIL